MYMGQERPVYIILVCGWDPYKNPVNFAYELINATFAAAKIVGFINLI